MNIVKKEVHHRLNTNLEEDFLYFVELPLFSSLSWSPCSSSWPPKCVWWQRSCSTASVVMLPPSHCARCLVPPGVALCARYLQVAAGVSSQDDLHHRSHLRYTATSRSHEHSYLTIARTSAGCVDIIVYYLARYRLYWG